MPFTTRVSVDEASYIESWGMLSTLVPFLTHATSFGIPGVRIDWNFIYEDGALLSHATTTRLALYATEIPALLIVVPLKGHLDITYRYNRLRIAAEKHLAIVNSEPVRGEFSDGFEGVVLTAPVEHLDEAARRHGCVDAGPAKDRMRSIPGVYDIAHDKVRSLHHCMCTMQPLLSSQDEVPAGLVHRIMDSLHELVSGELAGARQELPALPGYVCKAIDHIHMNSASKVSANAIAKAAGVSTRTLQNAFARHMHRSPTQLLQEIRLEKALALLMDTGNDMNVTEVASQCGFTHFGSFSVSYKKRFGELPSATRKLGQRLRSMLDS